MANNPLNDALTNLDTTINSITGKVNEAKANARNYRDSIIQRLKDIMEQLNNDAFKNIGFIKKQLKDTQEELAQKTQELSESQNALSEANKEIINLREQLANCNQRIQETEQTIADLQNKVGEQTAAREHAEEELRNLQEEKKTMESQLAEAQGQLSDIIGRIAQINDTLIRQILLIDGIVEELNLPNDNGEDVTTQFKAVGDNIQAIINLINNPGPSPSSGPSSGPSFVNTHPEPMKHLRTTPESRFDSRPKGGRKSKKNRIKNKKYKTNKNNRQRGGYVYKPVSHKLGKSSLVVSNFGSSTKSTKSIKSTKSTK